MNNEKASVSITLNGAAAEATIDNLRNKADRYRLAIEQANKAGDMKLASNMQKNLDQVNRQLRNVTKETNSYKKVLDDLSGHSLAELKRAYTQLRKEVSKLNPVSDEFIQKSKNIKVIKGRMNELTGTISKQHSIWEKMSSSFNKYFGMATAFIASITGLSIALKSANDEAAKMDDTYSDVMKTTGMTKNQVEKLNTEFQKLDTRTTRENLNNLARDAGKLGIASKDILEFVRAADKINVSLGEDLGEDAIINIGKIADIFGITSKLGVEKAYLAIGSAINAIGQSSSASEGYLVDFSQRVAGAAAQAGISIQNVIGYASALDQSGMKVEMAATAFQTFVLRMFSDVENFAKYAQMSVSDFSKLLGEDANSAIIKVLSSLNKAGGLKELVPMFKDMGADGARAVSVLASIATNIDKVTVSQSESNKEFELANSLEEEFLTKNNNKMAVLDKAKKRFKDSMIELGNSLSPFFVQTTNLSSIAIKVLAAFGKEIVITAGSVAAAYAAVKLYNARVKIASTLTSSWTVINKGAAIAMNLLSGNVVRASINFKAMKAAMSTSTIGVIAAAITSIGVAIAYVVQKSREGSKATRDFFSQTELLKNEAESLLGIINDNVSSSIAYKEAISLLEQKYGSYITHLINEKGELKDIAAARLIINNEIEREIANKIQSEEINKISEKRLGKMASAFSNIIDEIAKRKNISKEAAAIIANQASEMIKSGKDVSQVWNKLFKDFGYTPKNDYLGSMLSKFKGNYKEMLKEIKDVKQNMSFLTEQTFEFEGPTLDKSKVSKVVEEIKDYHTKLSSVSEQERKENFMMGKEKIDTYYKLDLIELKKAYISKNITLQEYENKRNALELNYLSLRHNYNIANNQAIIENNEEFYNQSIEDEQKYLDKMISLANEVNKIEESIRNKYYQHEGVDVPEFIIPEDAGYNDYLNNIEQQEKKAAEIKDKYNKKSWADRESVDFFGWRKLYKNEMSNLEELLSNKMITQEEFEKSSFDMKLAFAAKAAESVANITNSVMSLLSTLKETEMAQLDVMRQKELAADGTTADKRAAIDAKYEGQKLELQKKYADMDMGIKIAQAIAAGALAITMTFAQLGMTPWGIAAASIMGATTLAQIAVIVAQRNAIMSQGGASDSPSPVAQRTVDGFSEGGYTPGSYSDDTPVGVVHANEWVAPAQMVRDNPIIFKLLEDIRTKRNNKSSGYKDGGVVTSNSNYAQVDISPLLGEIRELITFLKNQSPVEAYIVYQNLKKAEKMYDNLRQFGSR